jgi:hypothetical protein
VYIVKAVIKILLDFGTSMVMAGVVFSTGKKSENMKIKEIKLLKAISENPKPLIIFAIMVTIVKSIKKVRGEKDAKI